jgi:hypothetical protein
LTYPVCEAELSSVETIRCVYTPEFVFTERRQAGHPPTSAEEERSELLDSVLQTFKTSEDEECLTVCGDLLRHLAKAGRRL